MIYFGMNQKLTTAIPEEVVRRFALKRGMPLAEAFSLAQQLESFLEAAAFTSARPTREVDAIWHEFILHTRIYSEYCMERFQRFVHHVPTSPVGSEAPTQSGDGNCRSCVSECGSGG